MISEGHARSLLSVENEKAQELFLTKIIVVEKLSVRELESLVSQQKRNSK